MKTAKDFLNHKGIGTGTNISLKMVENLLDEYADRFRRHPVLEQGYDLERLYEWLMTENKKPAITAFTSGVARNIASEIEFRLSYPKQNEESPEKDPFWEIVEKEKKLMKFLQPTDNANCP